MVLGRKTKVILVLEVAADGEGLNFQCVTALRAGALNGSSPDMISVSMRLPDLFISIPITTTPFPYARVGYRGATALSTRSE
jgi:hypothetical protein